MSLNKHALLVALVLALGSALPAQAQVAPTGQWTNMASSDNYMYYFAGCTDGARYAYYVNPDYNELQIYDSSTNSWTYGASPEYYWYEGSSTFSGGVMYVFVPEYYASNILTYNPASDSWGETSASISLYEGSAACTDSSGVIWFGGGWSNNFYSYNPSTQVLTARANQPIQTYWATLTCVPTTGRIYLIGGYNANTGNPSTATYEYDPAQNQWTQLGNRPVSVYGHGAFSLRGRVYTCAGYNYNTGYLTACYEFAPTSNTWTRRATLPNYHSFGVGMGVTGTQYGWIFGGETGYFATDRFTPPVFGADPDPASNVVQIGSLGVMPQAGADPNLGWTNTQIRFQADVKDPDAGQQVRLEVQVKLAGGSWTGAPIVSSPLQAQGTIGVDYTLPAGGDYDWRYRVADDYDNYTPNTGGVPGWTEFENNAVSPDFRSDQVAPPPPTFVYPTTEDITGPSLEQNDVTLVWNPTTDNGPTAALRYSVEVSFNDPAFGNILASASGLPATQHTFTLPVSRYNYYWRLGATDIGGNFSGWATGAYFRVLGDDGINHSSGDATKILGCSAGASAGSLAAVMIGLLALGAGIRRLAKS